MQLYNKKKEKRKKKKGMKNVQLFLNILGIIVGTIGVVMVYDARPITSKFFSFGDQNEASLGLKMIGFIITVIGAIIVICNQ